MLHRRDFLAAALGVPAAWLARSERRWRAFDTTRLGASTACLAGFSLLNAIQQIQRAGFGTIEMIAYTGARHSVGEIPGFAFQEASPQEREHVFQATRPFRHISAHLPFQDIHLFSANPAVRKTGLAALHAALDGLAYLKGELAVMHVGWPDKGMRFRDIWQPMIDTLRALGDYAAARSLRLGIETMQPDSVRDYTELIVAVDHPHVGATIDTGHIRGSTDIGLPADRRDTDEARARFNDVLNALVAGLGPKTLHFHLSDVRREDWADHRALGSGIVDFPRLFATLDRLNYGGLFVLELEEKEQLAALENSKAYMQAIHAGQR